MNLSNSRWIEVSCSETPWMVGGDGNESLQILIDAMMDLARMVDGKLRRSPNSRPGPTVFEQLCDVRFKVQLFQLSVSLGSHRDAIE